jgi:hypothetical protein
MLPGVERVPATEFAMMARRLAAGCRELGLAVPAFRSPPRVAGRSRTIRRTGTDAVVAVQLRGRGSEAVAQDMIEGIVVANRLHGAKAAPVRRRLGELVGPVDVDLPQLEAAQRRNLTVPARVAERQTQAA